MRILDTNSAAAFMERFYHFYDGVVRRISIHLEQHPMSIDITVDAQDAESPSGWARLHLQLQGVASFRLEVGATSFEVLSSGIQIGWDAGRVTLFLDAYPDDDGLPDISTNKGYIVGESLHWTAVPVPVS